MKFEDIIEKCMEKSADAYEEAKRIIEQQESMLRGHEDNIDKLEDENESLRQDLKIQTRIQQEYKQQRDMFKDELSKFIKFVETNLRPARYEQMIIGSVMKAAEELKRWLEERER